MEESNRNQQQSATSLPDRTTTIKNSSNSSNNNNNNENKRSRKYYGGSSLDHNSRRIVNVARLPDAILAHIVSFLPHFPDVNLNVRLVSKRFHKNIVSSPLVWRSVQFPSYTPPGFIASSRFPLSRETRGIEMRSIHVADDDLRFIAEKCDSLEWIWMPAPRRAYETAMLRSPLAAILVGDSTGDSSLPNEEYYVSVMESSHRTLSDLNMECYSEKIVFRKDFPNLTHLLVNIRLSDIRSWLPGLVRQPRSYGSSGPFLRSIVEHCRNLEQLHIATDDLLQVTDDTLAAIGASCPKLTQLTISSLRWNLNFDNVSDAGMNRLLQSLPNLEWLALDRFAGVSSAIFCFIARYCPNIKDIRLCEMPAVGRVPPSLLSRPTTTTGVSSSPAKNDDDDDDDEFPAMKKLTSMSLKRMEGLTHAGLAAVLERCPNMTSLHIESRQRMEGNNVMRAVASLPQLEILSAEIHAENCNEADFKAIFECCAKLKTLRIYPHAHNDIAVMSDEILISIGQNLPNLEKLNLSRCGISAEGIQTLIEGCRVLADLGLHQANTDAAATQPHELNLSSLTKSFASLKRLSLDNICHLTPKDFAALIRAAPGLEKLDVMFSESTAMTSTAAVAIVSRYCSETIKYLAISFRDPALGGGSIPLANVAAAAGLQPTMQNARLRRGQNAQVPLRTTSAAMTTDDPLLLLEEEVVVDVHDDAQGDRTMASSSPSSNKYLIRPMPQLTDITLYPHEYFDEKLLLMLMASCSAPASTHILWLIMESLGRNWNLERPLFCRLFFQGWKSAHLCSANTFLRRLAHEIVYYSDDSDNDNKTEETENKNMQQHLTCVDTLLHNPDVVQCIKRAQQLQEQRLKQLDRQKRRQKQPTTSTNNNNSSNDHKKKKPQRSPATTSNEGNSSSSNAAFNDNDGVISFFIAMEYSHPATIAMAPIRNSSSNSYSKQEDDGNGADSTSCLVPVRAGRVLALLLLLKRHGFLDKHPQLAKLVRSF